jgi:hypothetical protein
MRPAAMKSRTSADAGHTSRHCMALFVGLISFLAAQTPAQELKRHLPLTSPCPPVHLRVSARNGDGSPATSLRPQDFRVLFLEGEASVISAVSGVSTQASKPVTNILFVVAPYSDLKEVAVRTIYATLIKADNFLFNTAVLSPDGTSTAFSTDLELLETHLQATLNLHISTLSGDRWPFAERNSFMALRKLPGRHVIVELRDPANPYHSTVKARFDNDATLEALIPYDMAQIYRLVDPVLASALIPMGDASTLHTDIGPENHGAWQLQEVQRASAAQSYVWAQQNLIAQSGGRAEGTVDALLQDILRDAPAAYDLLAQPSFPCRLGGMYPVLVSARSQNIRIFGPQQVQIVPAEQEHP